MKYEEDSDIESSSTMPLVPSPKKKKKQVKTTDPKARGMLHFRGHAVYLYLDSILNTSCRFKLEEG